MAPSGQKLGKLVHPACDHSPFAKAFQTAHLCWQDRISKEQNALISVSLNPSKEKAYKPPSKSQSLSALELARSEYHPIGGYGPKNNASGQIAATLGPKSWAPSGGVKSEYRCHVGQATLAPFGAPAHVHEAEFSSSYLGNEMRAEGRRKGHADQQEAIQQHGSGTILRKARGEVAAISPAEEQVLRGQYFPKSDQQRAASAASGGASVRSIRSFASVGSKPEDELQRIHALGGKVRQIAHKGAKAQHLQPMLQRGERTILGQAAKGLIPAENQRRSSADSIRSYSRVSTGTTESFGTSVYTDPGAELMRIHDMAKKARDIGQKGARAHQLQAVREGHLDDHIGQLH